MKIFIYQNYDQFGGPFHQVMFITVFLQYCNVRSVTLCRSDMPSSLQQSQILTLKIKLELVTSSNEKEVCVMSYLQPFYSTVC